MDYIFRGFHPDKNRTQVVVVNGKEYRGEWVEVAMFTIII